MSEWVSFKNQRLSKVDHRANGILSTLKLSYNHLPSHLKHCFAYCSLFPKDTEIDASRLIQLWIAQGYVESSDPSECLDDIGLVYFMDLYRRSFFQEVAMGELGNIENCKMHDLMHDLAMSVAGDECAIASSSDMAWVKARHLLAEFDQPNIPSLLKARKLRTLLTSQWHTPPRYPEKGLHAIFCKLRCLRVLYLFGSSIVTVPSSIYKLKHLRYLDLSENLAIEKLPDSITKLHNLQVLRLNVGGMLSELPKDIKKLVNISHLDNSNCDWLTHMPRGIGQLTRLEKLPLFVIAEDSCVWNHSGGLEELHGLNKLAPLCFAN